MEESRTATLLAIAAEALRGLVGRRFEPAAGYVADLRVRSVPARVPSKRRAGSLLLLVVAAVGVPMTASAQSKGVSNKSPGFYAGVESGLNWLLNNDNNGFNNSYNTGYAIGGVAGYDFLGPRVELEVMYRNNAGTTATSFGNASGQVNQLSTMVNGLYDFMPGSIITPYAGAGLGLAFASPGLLGPSSLGATAFAYQGIVGVGYNATPLLRVNLDARYYGTSNPGTYTNNDISVMLGVTYKLGSP